MMDRLAAGSGDHGSQTLWEAHVARASAAARQLKAGTPRPGLAKRDPFALRALVAILLVATFVAAGSDRWRLLRSAFDFRGAIASANYRIDAWVTPPTYTGRPPVLLPGVRAGEPVREAQTDRGADRQRSGHPRERRDARHRGARVWPKRRRNRHAHVRRAAATEHRYTITESGSVTVRGAGRDIIWTFTAIPDRAPTIALAKDPEPQARGAVQLTYRIEDDYGVDQSRGDSSRRRRPEPHRAAALWRADFAAGPAAGAHAQRRRPDR